MNFYIETYGCSHNTADSEAIAGVLSEEHEQVDRAEDADIIVVNTCIVKSPTENKVRDAIKKYAATGKKLIVAGCMPEAQRDIVEGVAPEAEIWGVKHSEVLKEPRIRANKVVGIVPISSGCVGECTYCIVRFARGRLMSYPMKDVVGAVKHSVEEGCREIWITSQDTGAYGIDIGKSLPELLKEVCAVPGDFKVRVGMMNPNHVAKMLPDLINAMKHEKMFKFLHLPAQSGSDDVLKNMNRFYNVGDYKEIVEGVKKEIPKITIATDIIVGFPGETDEQFEDSVKLIKKTMPDIVNISRFGVRPGTPAAEMKQLPTEVKKERSRELTKVVQETGLKRNQKWIGWEGEVLIDEHGTKNDFVGRNFAYKPVVVKGEHELGDVVNVKIKSATNSYLVAE